jgi:type IV pilus assembly protein PilW
MNKTNNRSYDQQSLSKGFTLVELMITLVLSLIITYGIAQLLINSNRTSVTSDGMSQSQETGRFVLSFLANQIRQAGLDSTTDDSISASAFISCTDFPALIDNDACITEGVGGENQTTIVNPIGIHGDRLAIAWVSPSANITDCTGSTGHRPIGAAPTVALTDYVANDVIINTIWVASDATSGMNSLFCQGFLFDGTDVTGSSPQQAIANGVEAMQLLYGEATAPLLDTSDRNVSRYVPAAVLPTAVTLTDVQNWDRVYAVKVSLMTRSITAVTNNDTLRSYVLANAAPYDMTDAVSRQVFNTTFTISNYQ